MSNFFLKDNKEDFFYLNLHESLYLLMPDLLVLYLILGSMLNLPYLIFIIIFHVFVISFCILTNRVTYFSSNSFLIRNNIPISDFTLVFFKAAYHANLGAEINFSGSDSYILRHIFQKFSNTSANNNINIKS